MGGYLITCLVLSAFFTCFATNSLEQGEIIAHGHRRSKTKHNIYLMETFLLFVNCFSLRFLLQERIKALHSNFFCLRSSFSFVLYNAYDSFLIYPVHGAIYNSFAMAL